MLAASFSGGPDLEAPTRIQNVGGPDLGAPKEPFANHDEVYPLAATIEYHFSGFDARFEGMDWRSVRLVLEQENGTWYLVGLIHDEWTI